MEKKKSLTGNCSDFSLPSSLRNDVHRCIVLHRSAKANRKKCPGKSTERCTFSSIQQQGVHKFFPVTFSLVKVNLNFSPFRFATSRWKLGFVAQPIMQLGIATMKGSGNLIKTSDNCFQRSEFMKPFWSIVSAELVIKLLMNKVTN